MGKESFARSDSSVTEKENPEEPQKQDGKKESPTSEAAENILKSFDAFKKNAEGNPDWIGIESNEAESFLREINDMIVTQEGSEYPQAEEIKDQFNSVVGAIHNRIASRLSEVESGQFKGDADGELSKLQKGLVMIHGLSGVEDSGAMIKRIDELRVKHIMESIGLEPGMAAEKAPVSPEQPVQTEKENMKALEGFAEEAASFDDLLSLVEANADDGLVQTRNIGSVSVKKLAEAITDVRDKKQGWEGWLSSGPLQSYLRKLNNERETNNAEEAPVSSEQPMQPENESVMSLESFMGRAASFDELIMLVETNSKDGYVETDRIGRVLAEKLIVAAMDVRDKKPGWEDWLHSGPLQDDLRRLNNERGESEIGEDRTSPEKEPIESDSETLVENVPEVATEPAQTAEADPMAAAKEEVPFSSEQPMQPEKEGPIDRREFKKRADEAGSFEELIAAVRDYSIGGYHDGSGSGKQAAGDFTKNVIDGIDFFKYRNSGSLGQMDNFISDPTLKSNIIRLLKERERK